MLLLGRGKFLTYSISLNNGISIFENQKMETVFRLISPADDDIMTSLEYIADINHKQKVKKAKLCFN